MSHPCLVCGACCASFRVSFYWAETSDHPDGQVPSELVEAVSPHHVCMRGTGSKPVRCVALEGDVGTSTRCRIYAQRSSTCRDFTAGSETCQQARALHGLPALRPQDLPPQPT